MDLAKAKSIIIVMLVAFNLFLLFNNLTYFKGQGVQKETIENAEKILNARGITLENNISTYSKETHRLQYGNGTLDKAAMAEKLLGDSYVIAQDGKVFENADKKLEFFSDTIFMFMDDKPSSKVDVGNIDNVGRVARAYLKDKDLSIDDYIVDLIQHNKDGSVTMTFIEKYHDFLVYDNYCIATMNANGIKQLEYGRRQIVGFSPKKLEDQVDAYQVLLAHFTEDKELVITNIDIGYKYLEDQSMDEIESLELLPIWRVKIKDVPDPLYLGTPVGTEEPAAGLNAN